MWINNTDRAHYCTTYPIWNYCDKSDRLQYYLQFNFQQSMRFFDDFSFGQWKSDHNATIHFHSRSDSPWYLRLVPPQLLHRLKRSNFCDFLKWPYLSRQYLFVYTNCKFRSKCLRYENFLCGFLVHTDCSMWSGSFSSYRPPNRNIFDLSVGCPILNAYPCANHQRILLI